MKSDLKIAIVGAGAIGGITAALMSQAGYNVELVTKHQNIADIANSKGIKISGTVSHEVITKSVPKISQLNGVKDICIIATKAYDLQDAARQLLPHADKDTLFVSMQNGICTDALAEVVGAERTVGCVVGFGATMNGPADLVKTSEGDFIIGMLDGKSSERLGRLKQALSYTAPTVISDNIYEQLYSKLIINSCITSLGAICGLKLGQMLQIKKVRNIFIEIIREAMKVADALQIKVPKYGGKVDYYSMASTKMGLSNFKRHLIIKIVGNKYKNLKSSSLQSLERGGKTEIDFFNGYISNKAKALNISTPVNDRIVELIKEIEAKNRSISIDNFNDDVFANM